MQEPIAQLLKRPVAQKKGWIQTFKIAQHSRNTSQAREEVGMSNVMQRFLSDRPISICLSRKIRKKKVRVGQRNNRKKFSLTCKRIERRSVRKKRKVGNNHRKILTSVYTRTLVKRKFSSMTSEYPRGVKRKKTKFTR